MNKEIFVSIIVPVSKFNKNLEECIINCQKLNYSEYELIILSDESFDFPGNHVRIIPTGKMGPAGKRNIGVEKSKGNIIAFIDDDTYPEPDWLKVAVRNFKDPYVAAVGGPAVTPKSDTNLQKASGAVYESFVGGGVYRYRYIPGKRQYVDDFPSCNFIVRKSILEKLGGFRTNFWPGEDTALCLDIVHKLDKKIVYDPQVLIYHHRRSLFKGHLLQVRAYALHRGYFAKRFPKTSLRLSYFLPSILVLCLLFGWIISVELYFIGVAFYLLLCIFSVLSFRKIRFLTLLGIISTHIVYGIWCIIGLFSKKLKEE